MSVTDSLRRYLPGQFQAALRYYWVQARVLQESWLDRLHTTSPDDLPLPPARLRFRVHGAADAATFLEAGQQCANDIRRALNGVSREVESFSQVLDFGCGCGRVLRGLRSEGNPCLTGADIDGEAIAWCHSHLPFANFFQNTIDPPLPFAAGTFDLVYGVSVFTHLDEKKQNAWLQELKRVTQPGAILLLTVHGDLSTSGLPPSEIRMTHERGFFFKMFQTGKYKSDGLPDFYQSAFHTRKYVNQVWSQFFEVIDYLPREMNGHQDIVLLRR